MLGGGGGGREGGVYKSIKCGGINKSGVVKLEWGWGEGLG